jgi:hypothetical protein
MLATAWPIVLITAIGLVVAYQFVAPEPPRRITITTGSDTGAYYAYAQRYAVLLASKGITLDIRTSAGSHQNLERLEKGEADIAFVQGGMCHQPRARTTTKVRCVRWAAFPTNRCGCSIAEPTCRQTASIGGSADRRR